MGVFSFCVVGSVLVPGDINGDDRTDLVCQSPEGNVCYRYNSFIFANGRNVH